MEGRLFVSVFSADGFQAAGATPASPKPPLLLYRKINNAALFSARKACTDTRVRCVRDPHRRAMHWAAIAIERGMFSSFFFRASIHVAKGIKICARRRPRFCLCRLRAFLIRRACTWRAYAMWDFPLFPVSLRRFSIFVPFCEFYSKWPDFEGRILLKISF